MRKIFLAILIMALTSSMAYSETTITPEQLAQKVYDRYIGDDMQLKGTMELISKNGHIRTREFISARKDKQGDRMQLIRFISPADIKGTAFLTLEKEGNNKTEQHLYLPALKRTRRIVASQKGRSFVNSDFTYEDMQRQPVEDWQYQIDGEDTFVGRKCFILTSTPKPDTETQYSKATSCIDQEHMMVMKTDFYDKKGKHAKSYTVNNFEIIDQIATETDVLMADLHSNHQTRLISQKIIYNSGLKDSLFTKQAMER